MAFALCQSSELELKKIGTDPNCRRTDSCKCKTGCSSHRTCGCSKFGSGCNAKCLCTGLCKNMFNDLDYFFGPGHRNTANPCFYSYLTQLGANGFQTIDRDELRDRILKNGR